MLGFNYECRHEGILLHFRVTGFATYNKLIDVKNEIIKEIQAKEAQKKPYKILFDLRGLKALDPRAVEALHELDKAVYESSVVKVGTVLDSVIAKLQQLRVANQYPMDNAFVFSDYDKCIQWLNDEIEMNTDAAAKKFGV